MLFRSNNLLTNPFYIEKMKLWGYAQRANNGIIASFRSNFHIKDVDVFECANGVVYSATNLGTSENMRFYDCSRVGIYLGNDAFIPAANLSTCRTHNFNNIIVAGNTSLGIRAYKATNINFNQSEILNLGHTQGYTPSLTFEGGLISPNGTDRKSTRLNSSHIPLSRMPSSA